MGHRPQCTNQSQSIKKKEDMKKMRLESNGCTGYYTIVMNFKIKFNPINARESLVPLIIMVKVALVGIFLYNLLRVQ